METLIYAPAKRECAIIFTEGGLSSLRFSDTTVKHRVPANQIMTEAQFAAYLSNVKLQETKELEILASEKLEYERLHPKGKRYLHEVLAVAEEAKLNPRTPDECDEPWLAFLREHGNIRGEVKYENMVRFNEQMQAATGDITFDCTRHPAIYIHREAANKYANNLSITWHGQIPEGCPVEVHSEPDGSFVIFNTRFIWRLIAREGFRLDP